MTFVDLGYRPSQPIDEDRDVRHQPRAQQGDFLGATQRERGNQRDPAAFDRFLAQEDSPERRDA